MSVRLSSIRSNLVVLGLSSALLMNLISTRISFAGVEPPCPDSLLTSYDAQVTEALADKGWFERRGLRRKLEQHREVIQQEILRRCPDPSKCEFETLREVTGKVIAEFISKNGRKVDPKVVAIFGGAVIANAALTTLIKYTAPAPVAEFFVQCISLVVTTFIVALAGPILKPLTAPIARKMWAGMGAEETPDVAADRMHRFFEEANRSSNQRLSELAQGGRGVAGGALGPIKADLVACRNVMALGPDQGEDFCLNLFAITIHQTVQNYGHLDLSDPYFARMVRKMYTNDYVTRRKYPSVYAKIWEGLKAMDPEGMELDVRRAHYEKVVRAWFDPEEPVAAESFADAA